MRRSHKDVLRLKIEGGGLVGGRGVNTLALHHTSHPYHDYAYGKSRVSLRPVKARVSRNA